MATASTSIPDRRWAGLALWLGLAGVATLVLWTFRSRLDTAHMALAYLLLVLAGSARRGRLVGLVLSVVCFLAFNFFLIEPYYTLALHEPLDLWVLVAFLVTGAVAAQLLHRAQRAAEVAETRARELDRLSAMVAESLAVPRAVDAVRAIARVVGTELPVDRCQILMVEPSGDLRDAEEGATPSEPEAFARAVRERRLIGRPARAEPWVAGPDATVASLRSLLPTLLALEVPLQVRERVVGVMVLSRATGLAFDEEQARFADAVSYYAALAVERARLTAESEHVGALLEADRMKDAVLASVSHDLRTPLTSIQAHAAELRAGGDERAVIIEEEAIRLNRMVTDLLDLSRIRTGSLRLETQLIAAEDVIGAALQRIGGGHGSDRIDVRLPADGSLPVGRIDFSHTLRVVVNLLENALRHSPPGERVELDVAEEDGSLLIRVLDRGPGIPEADRARIFEPFYLGGDGGPGRVGLGLSIARSLTSAQGGTVGHRPRPGGGSVFELRLPLGHVDLEAGEA